MQKILTSNESPDRTYEEEEAIKIEGDYTSKAGTNKIILKFA